SGARRCYLALVFRILAAESKETGVREASVDEDARDGEVDLEPHLIGPRPATSRRMRAQAKDRPGRPPPQPPPPSGRGPELLRREDAAFQLALDVELRELVESAHGRPRDHDDRKLFGF